MSSQLPDHPRPNRAATWMLLVAYLGILCLALPITVIDRSMEAQFAGRQLESAMKLIEPSWILAGCCLYAYGLARLLSLHLLTRRGLTMVLAVPPALGLLLAAGTEWALLGYVWLGFGLTLTWGVVWAETGSTFLGTRGWRRAAWIAIGTLAPAALVLVPIQAFIMLLAMYEFQGFDIVMMLQVLGCLVLVVVACWRSIYTRRAARRWLQSTPGADGRAAGRIATTDGH